ncbi:MAG TPA: alkaline phosphatase D family protein [Acidimicrobiales bacterium]|nr:alkaline phosphatase D family protein [Acidimicrobiales bacterium]
MADLILGPLLRFADDTQATVWVEVDEPCTVDVLGTEAPTFTVEGHHYALVVLDGLEPGSETPYEVRLDGEVRWPEPGSDFPPSVIRTIHEDTPFTMAFGSCRASVPHEPPWTLPAEEHEDAYEHDALRVLARELYEGDRQGWPDYLLLLGDQVYVDLGAPRTREFIRSRRGPDDGPGEEVVDYEEYSHLYHEAWTDPLLRWLFSTVSVGMIWDDHDMGDDWNISAQWVEEMEELDWWHVRRRAGFISYWIHQHVGNLSPDELDENDVWRKIRDGGEVTHVFDDFVEQAGATGDGVRWSHARDFGRTRLVCIDSRAGRVFDDGPRKMVEKEAWEWLCDRLRGDVDHLVIATSDPYLLLPPLHDLEAWNEKVCDGAWGAWFAKQGEKLRREIDLDHWAAFEVSFQSLTDVLRDVAAGRRGQAPASITILSGDVHHAYLMEVDFRDEEATSAMHQAVCSPVRNPLDKSERRVIRFATTPVARGIGWLLRKTGRVPDPTIRWKLVEGPWFDNQIGTLHHDGCHADVRLDKTIPVADDEGERRLERVFERSLTG